MFIKSLIATAAFTLVLAIASPATRAHAGESNSKLGIAIGGGFSSHYGHHAYNSSHIICWKRGRIVDWPGFNPLNPVDCRLPGYKYNTWHRDHDFLVRINDYGGIAGGSSLF